MIENERLSGHQDTTLANTRFLQIAWEHTIAMAHERTVTTIRSDLDVVTARTSARDVARTIGFVGMDQARIATTVSELARNIFLYAGMGHVTVCHIEQHGRNGIELIFEDHGPGIENIEQYRKPASTIPTGAGMGLPGAQRLMDEFEIYSKKGLGTTIICRKWKV